MRVGQSFGCVAVSKSAMDFWITFKYASKADLRLNKSSSANAILSYWQQLLAKPTVPPKIVGPPNFWFGYATGYS